MKFKNSIFAVLMVISQIPALGQIGIGTNNPEGLLDLSMTQGFVYPRVDLVNTTTATITTPDGNPPVIGTMVYNTKNSGTDATAVYPGLYQWDGTQWVAQFDKKDNKIYIQNRNLSTGHSVGQQGVSFDSKTFVPQYYGTYKIKVSLHFGAGKMDLNSSSEPEDQHANFGAQGGDFVFNFNGQNHTVSMKSFSGNNNDTQLNGGTLKEYTNAYNQAQFTILETDLIPGESYNIGLTFEQLIAHGFVSDGALGTDGSGHVDINGDLGCVIEISYIDE
jgi:hypothetical protein